APRRGIPRNSKAAGPGPRRRKPLCRRFTARPCCARRFRKRMRKKNDRSEHPTLMSLAPGMHIEQKKGDPLKLKGKLTAYVRILDGGQGEGPFGSSESSGAADASNPLHSMVRNG